MRQLSACIAVVAMAVLGCRDPVNPDRPGTTQAFYNVVPLTPPGIPDDSIKQRVHDPSNQIVDGPVYYGTIPSNLLWVRFQPTATQQQRQTAVDTVGGVVIGGEYLDDGGLYFVEITGDSTGQALHTANTLLRTLPWVASATVDLSFMFSSLHRRPNDGSNWQRNDYALSRASAPGDNWHLEAVSAPLAWGCEVGSDTTDVLVFDKNFTSSATDVLSNVTDTSLAKIDKITDVKNPGHGTSVSSVFAARGNNGAGMSGTMWHADVKWISADTWSMWERMIEDVATGDVPRVINISLGIDWSGTNQSSSTRLLTASDLSTQLVLAAHLVRNAATNRGVPIPLIVIGAGNSPYDGFWSGLSEVSDTANVITVAAITSSRALASFSARNCPGAGCTSGWDAPTGNAPSVLIAAPGEGVYAYNQYGTINAVNGTSIAAPIVAGIAGLLATFDPQLNGDSIKSILLRTGTDSANGIPIVNAHEALKEAARRKGAPLCGNRMWWDGADLIVQRRVASGGAPEILDTIGSSSSPQYDLRAFHGGKRVQFGWPLEEFSFGSSWSGPFGGTAPDTLIFPGGSNTWGASHDEDMMGYAYRSSPYDSVDIFLYTLPDYAESYVGSIAATPPETDTICTVENKVTSECATLVHLAGLSYQNGWDDIPTLAYSPWGDTVYVSVPTFATQIVTTGSWATCSSSSAHRCRSVDFRRDVVSTSVYRVPIATGVPQLAFTVDSAVFGIGMSEAGVGEFVLYRGTATGQSTYHGFQQAYPQAITHTNCRTEYRTGGQLHRTVALSVCPNTDGVTIAPGRSAIRQHIREATAPASRWPRLRR